MSSQSVNSQSTSAQNSLSKEENQIEHFKKMSTGSKVLTSLVVLALVAGVIGGVYYWYKNGGKLPSSSVSSNVGAGIKKFTDSA